MKITKLFSIEDKRGDLTPLEFSDLPFIPQRMFIVKNCNKGIERGHHAHHKTLQIIICLKGEIKVVTHDGISLDRGILKEGQYTLIKNYHWDSQEFLTGNDILLVVCSTPYDESDYILNFDEFIKITKERSTRNRKLGKINKA